MIQRYRSLVDELYHAEGKAEIIEGRIVPMSPAGFRHGDAALEIAYSLRHHMKWHGDGIAVGDNVGFLVQLPNRQSFSPDAAWVKASRHEITRRFWNRAPEFAVEVRSPDDPGPAGDEAVEAKIPDYFAAGTLVVWDVDLDRDDVIRCHRASDPKTPQAFRRGDTADAEPVVAGWRFAVDDLFE